MTDCTQDKLIERAKRFVLHIHYSCIARFNKVSEADRLAARASRFGLQRSADKDTESRLQRRTKRYVDGFSIHHALRFATEGSSVSSSEGIEKLKKREARFKMNGQEMNRDDMRMKRAQRFGLAS
jgi:hypothetical protein